MKLHEQRWRTNRLDARTVETSDGWRVAEAYPASEDGGLAEIREVAQFVSAGPDIARALLTVLEHDAGEDFASQLPDRVTDTILNALKKAGVL